MPLIQQPIRIAWLSFIAMAIVERCHMYKYDATVVVEKSQHMTMPREQGKLKFSLQNKNTHLRFLKQWLSFYFFPNWLIPKHKDSIFIYSKLIDSKI